METEQHGSSEFMTIHQLSESTGVPPRRIRHFVAEGLLPPPEGRGRAAHYTRGHADRLRQIQALRDVNLGLDDIRQRLVHPTVNVSEEGSPEVWRRWVIAPGIELQARTDLEPDVAAVARVLVRVARQLIESEDVGG
jgi:DNA-binding transcriptional MerR regulator